jgi:hypothetical protein
MYFINLKKNMNKWMNEGRKEGIPVNWCGAHSIDHTAFSVLFYFLQ